MSPAPRAALALAAIAVASLLAGPVLVALAAAALLAATAADALAVRRAPAVRRTLPPVTARGVGSPMAVTAAAEGRMRMRQPAPPDLAVEPPEVTGTRLEAQLIGRRRGRHALEPPAIRRTGPLGLGRWDHRPGEPVEVLVYPDYPAARRLALAVRQGRFRESGRITRGPLGLGTDFESIRDYLPDDDVRQINWAASERAGRPMSNTYRVEQDREVMVLLDAGRLMSAPAGEATRLDVAIDAALAVALVADALGDRCGALAFDREIRRHVPPRRAGGNAVLRALYDLEPRPEEPNYELAFRTVAGGKRSLIVVFTDLIEETAARPLVDAIPVLARRHAIIVAGATDDDLTERLVREPARPAEAYAAAVALDVLAARARVAHSLRAAGAMVVEGSGAGLGAACVRAYLRAKARARA